MPTKKFRENDKKRNSLTNSNEKEANLEKSRSSKKNADLESKTIKSKEKKSATSFVGSIAKSIYAKITQHSSTTNKKVLDDSDTESRSSAGLDNSLPTVQIKTSEKSIPEDQDANKIPAKTSLAKTSSLKSRQNSDDDSSTERDRFMIYLSTNDGIMSEHRVLQELVEDNLESFIREEEEGDLHSSTIASLIYRLLNEFEVDFFIDEQIRIRYGNECVVKIAQKELKTVDVKPRGPYHKKLLKKLRNCFKDAHTLHLKKQENEVKQKKPAPVSGTSLSKDSLAQTDTNKTKDDGDSGATSPSFEEGDGVHVTQSPISDNESPHNGSLKSQVEPLKSDDDKDRFKMSTSAKKIKEEEIDAKCLPSDKIEGEQSPTAIETKTQVKTETSGLVKPPSSHKEKSSKPTNPSLPKKQGLLSMNSPILGANVSARQDQSKVSVLSSPLAKKSKERAKRVVTVLTSPTPTTGIQYESFGNKRPFSSTLKTPDRGVNQIHTEKTPQIANTKKPRTQPSIAPRASIGFPIPSVQAANGTSKELTGTTTSDQKRKRVVKIPPKPIVSVDKLTYDWSSLNLDGTAAWNRLLEQQMLECPLKRKSNVLVTATDTYRLMQGLKESFYTVLPPEDSPLLESLRSMPKPSSKEMAFDMAKKKRIRLSTQVAPPTPESCPEDLRPIYPKMARLYQEMIAQDVSFADQSISLQQRAYQYMNAQELKEHMRSAEEDVVALAEREASILRTSRQLGLLGNGKDNSFFESSRSVEKGAADWKEQIAKLPNGKKMAKRYMMVQDQY